MSEAHISSILMLLKEFFFSRYLSSPVFTHLNRFLFTVCFVRSTMSLDCENSGLLVSCLKSQFADNFLNSSKFNSGPLSERTYFGIPGLANIFFMCFITLSAVEEFADIKVFGVAIHNNEVGSPLHLEQVRTNICPRFFRYPMIHE